ncbi:hypothetical protein [Streptomyces sp. NPDC004658]|uniref:hypothetical protein n=1 Tax=Streptomyces sp. NPDC004658 TaxID=3154672 RepID=UPI0033BAC052
MPRQPNGLWTWVVFGLFGAWLTVICYFIHQQSGHTPDRRGAVTVSDLRDDAAAAVRDRDPAAFERLLSTESAGPGYAEQYFEELLAEPVGEPAFTIVVRGRLRFLVLRGVSTAGPVCSSWMVRSSHGRSVLTTVPPLSNPCEADQRRIRRSPL